MINHFKFSLKHLLLLHLLYVLTKAVGQECNANNLYYEAVSQQCYAICPWSGTEKYYKYYDGSTLPRTCEAQCPGSYYGFDGNQSCTLTCPDFPTQTYKDTVNKRCVTECPANYFGYIGSDTNSNKSCVSNCPTGTFSNFDNGLCVKTCPSDTYYMEGSSPNCTFRCPQNYFGSPVDRYCKLAADCPDTPVDYYADETTNLCVQECPSGYFADSDQSRCLVFCSSGFFADDSTGVGVCVQDCPLQFYRDNVTRSCVRKCPKGYFINEDSGNCTDECPSDRFGDNATGKCEQQCLEPTFGDSTNHICVLVCPLGTFSDNYTRHCVAETSCYGNTIGDPTTRKCVSAPECPSTPYYFADLVAKLCKLKCPSTLWGDRSTKMCLSKCPWNPGTYVSWKNPHTQQCVTQCPEHPILYASNITQTCESSCPQPPDAPYATYADQISQQCLETCPIGFVSQDTDFICRSSCDSNPTILFYFAENTSCVTGCPEDYFADMSKQFCVTQCPSIPSLYGYDVNNTCLSECPEGYFADDLSRRCVEACPEATLQYGDISTNKCVDECPMIPDLYGQDLNDGNRTCVDTCDTGLFADPLTRQCLPKCNINEGYYGQSGRCVLECTSGFQDNTTAKCVGTCPRRPQYYYGNPVNKQCVLKCPEHLYANKDTNLCVQPTGCQLGYFADDYSNLCVSICPSVYFLFGQPTSHRCVQSCPEGLFADNTTRKCSGTCNVTAKLYKDPAVKACVYTCSSTPLLFADSLTMTCVDRCSNNQFAYDPQRKCVSICPTTPAYYGDYQTYRCVEKCPRETYSFVNNTFRGCVEYCPQRVYTNSFAVDLYADNSTWSCVPLCPQSEDLYNFKHPSDVTIRKCVKTCPMVDTTYYFAENVSQSCVTQCPTKTEQTFGDIYTFKCSQDCTMNQFRDDLKKRCTYECSDGYFSDNTTWDCVQQCPDPYFGYTINKTCLLECPPGFYAETTTRMCRADCQNKWYWFADPTTAQCVTTCPKIPNLFTNPDSKSCDYFCTLDRFADNTTGRCVPADKCLDGQVAEKNTKRCVYQCPIEVPSFKDNDTNLCQEQCPQGSYADNSTMICVAVCPENPDFYAYNDTNLGPICVLYCPSGYYRHALTRECLSQCPGPDYFKDQKSKSCVTQCPDHTFAETIGQVCIDNCGDNSKFGFRQNKTCIPNCPSPYYADSYNNSNLCVKSCPFTFFGEDNQCKSDCSTGFADPITKICESKCSQGYFAKLPEHICTISCEPQYAYYDESTCITDCPASQDLALNLYKETISYTCVNKCLRGWYADNSTRECSQTCSGALLADNSTGLCVQKCPENVDYFGFEKVCYSPCPNTDHYAENISRTCMAQCPSGSFADNTKRRCMDVCSGTQYAWDDPQSDDNLCLDVCPDDPLNLDQYYYALDRTKSCVKECDDGTFADNATHKCVQSCPEGSFADQNINVCVQQCSGDFSEYADPSTNKCVKKCPQVPSLYAQDNGRLCVITCENNWFRLNTTRSCVQDSCPIPFFADNSTGYCAYKCKIDQMQYADNFTRRCQPTCPNKTFDQNGTEIDVLTYADDSTKRCVFKCPDYPRLYGVNQTNRCQEACPPSMFGDNDTRICHDVCFFGKTAGIDGSAKYTWADPNTNFCVKDCPRKWFADNITVTCTQFCSFGTYADNSTWRCVAQCPVNPVSYSYEQDRLCVYECPDQLFGDEDGRICSQSCPITPYYYYKDYQNWRCVLNCTYPYYADKFSQSCSDICQFGYFKNIAEHTCQLCPDTCISCEAQLNCTSCQLGLYMNDGQCIATCPSFPIRYYADDTSSTCVLECQPPYFAFDGTGKCEIQCPETYYSQPDTKKCQNCPEGCKYCFRENCVSCLTEYVYAEQYGICSKACNRTHQYYVNGKCGEQCLEGTFLLSDLVTCQICSSQCLSCSNIGTNCTKCDGKFWYNYMCVASCPDNFFADADMKCQYCGDKNENCQLEPLRYDIQTQTIDYVLYANVIFNRQVNLTKDQFSKVVKIKSNNKYIKPSKFVVTQETPTTYRIKFLDSKSLNQMALSFGFEPGVIVDEYGNTVTTTEQTTDVATVTAVDQEVVEETVAVKQKVNVVSWILIAVVALLMIRYNYPLLLMVDTIQTIYMHTFILIRPLPYLWFNVNTILGYFHFNFLPKVYDLEATNTQSIKNPYSDFIYDTTFIGNMAPFLFFATIFLGVYLITWLLTIQKINRFESCRQKVRKLFKSRMRYSFIFQAFYYTFFYTIFFAIYQFKGYNETVQSAAANLGMAIVVLLVEVAMFIILIYVSAKTKDKILEVSECIKQKKRIPKISKRFRFLTYEPTRFPMQLVIRAFMKILFCGALQLQNVQAQLILLLSFNLIFLAYLIIFKPSLLKATNRLNMLITVCYMALEVVLFIYALGLKSTESQQTTSIACLAIQGFMVLAIVVWMVYRLVYFIRKKFLGKNDELSMQVEAIEKKKYYGRVKLNEDLQKQLYKIPSRKQKTTIHDNNAIFDATEKQINVSELNEQDQIDQQEEASVNADHLIKEFAYHFVPAKTEGLLKAQNKLLGVKKKKKQGPIVIQIDEDELIGQKANERSESRTRRQRTGHLRIQERLDDDLDVSQLESNVGSRQKMRSEKSEQKSSESEVIWGNIDARSNDSRE